MKRFRLVVAMPLIVFAVALILVSETIIFLDRKIVAFASLIAGEDLLKDDSPRPAMPRPYLR